LTLAGCVERVAHIYGERLRAYAGLACRTEGRKQEQLKNAGIFQRTETDLAGRIGGRRMTE
jgi:hypothetical protein